MVQRCIWIATLGDRDDVVDRNRNGQASFVQTVFAKWILSQLLTAVALPALRVIRPLTHAMRARASNTGRDAIHLRWFPQPFYPDSAPLILFDTSPWPADRFPPPTDVSADRYGNLVGISWTGKIVALGDRESETSPRFLVEAWTCIGGQIVFSPIGVGADLKAPDGSLTQVGTQVQDDAGCSEPSHAQVFLAHKDGYVGPVAVPWPP